MTFWVNGGERDYPEGLSFYDLAQKEFGSEAGKYLLAVENGRLRELFHRPRKGSEIHFLTMQDKAGFDTYRRSAVMLFFAALSNICGEETNAILHFSLGSGFYITLKGDTACSEALIQSVEEEMRRLVSLALPFRKRSVPTADAIRIFREKGQKDKVKLFRTRVASRVNIYTLDRYEDYYYGFMVHDTSAVKQFRLLPYRGGLILNLPLRTDPDVIPEFSTSGKFFDAQLQGEAWAEQQNISTVGDLNDNIISGKLSDTVLTSEALQESRIAWIAEQITSRSNVKFVMVAGPSSSGKTTFSQRLCIQLTAHGRVPHYIGVDNYFKNRDEMEVLPNGKKDFEGLSAVDIVQFNQDMTALLNGETVRMPAFDFVEGKRVYTGETLTLGADDLLVIEGIHCLNDALSEMLPAESKFRIYISALSQLNVDEHNRVPTADGRLIRRIVRDYRTRGSSASRSISMWDDVRQGEEKNIFPYQESADVVFNSALPYEIGALKLYVEPLLFQIEPEDPAYEEAKRLLKFLDYFIAIPSEGIPANSILREFIGGGCYHL